MDRTQKETFVSELRERINRAPVLYLTDFTGLNVKAMTELRSSLRKSGAEYVVVKNRLAKRVFVESDELPDISESLVGPTGFVFGYEDAAAAAKALSDFAKEHDKLVTRMLSIGGEVLPAGDLERLASLPTLDEARAMLLGVFQAPASQLVRVLNEPAASLARVLAAKAEQTEAA